MARGMTRTIQAGGIRWPKTCGDYRLVRLDVQPSSGPNRSPQFILRYANNITLFNVFLYRGGTVAATGQPATVETQLLGSSGIQILHKLAQQPGIVKAPIPLNVRQRE